MRWSLGWPAYEDALVLYAAPRIPHGSETPGQALVLSTNVSLAEAMAAFGQAAAAEGERMAMELAFCLNALLRLDDVTPDQGDRVAETLRDGVGYLAIGLETLASDVESAADALLRLGPRAVIRSGYAATWAPVAEARRLKKHESLLRLDPELRERVEALLSGRPRFVERLGPRWRRRGFQTGGEIMATLSALEAQRPASA